jgi:hypothetical protein
MVIAINPSLERGQRGRRLIGASDARIVIGTDETMRDPNACRDEHSGEPDPADLKNSPRNLNRHWYAAITGGMPLRWYIAALCCGTIVILLGWYPLSIVLILLSLPHDEIPTTSSNGSVFPVDAGHHNER